MVDMNKIADKLEDKYLVQQTEEAKEILAFVQFYRIQCALAESSDENSGLHKHGVNASNWKDKLEALIDGLEIENKEKLINDGDVETYKMLGEVMSSKIKQLKYWR